MAPAAYSGYGVVCYEHPSNRSVGEDGDAACCHTRATTTPKTVGTKGRSIGARFVSSRSREAVEADAQ